MWQKGARRPDFPNAMGWVARRPGTIVMRTFSKIYGLAGLRVGYGVADTELVALLERARHPFNVNLPAQVAALAALSDDDHVKASRAMNAEGIDSLQKELSLMGLRTWPTDANFILVDVGRPGAYQALLSQGVIVRPMEGFGLAGFIRITIGRPEENERAVSALRAFLGSSGAVGGQP